MPSKTASLHPTGTQQGAHPVPPSKSPATTRPSLSLSTGMNRLSLEQGPAGPLPPSSPPTSVILDFRNADAAKAGRVPQTTGKQNNIVRASPSPAPLQRSTSVISMRSRSVTPSLRHQASLNSLRGADGMTPPRSPAVRRTLSIGMLPVSAEVQVTAASIAKAHFEKELGAHDRPASDSTDVVVVLHDSCYGHRFSRPRTSKSSLGTIVERPERILSATLGVSAAYVLLGGRHSGGDYAPRPGASTSGPLPFKIRKSSRTVPLTSPAVVQVHGAKWMAELKTMCEGAERKLAANGKELARPRSLESGEQEERPELHDGDLYLCSESLEALEGALGGVCDAVDIVFDGSGPRRAFVSVRPPGHHCSGEYPSGFCWLNNVHVGIAHASLQHGLTHAAIIDFDLHHGDGSQAIAWAHNAKVNGLPKNAPMSKRTSIGYFSLHDINSYPCEYGDEEKVRNASLCIENAHGQNIWNVHLQPWKSKAEFWELYETRYCILLEKARAFLKRQAARVRSLPGSIQPKAAIFISAGFDASEWEGQGMQRHKANVPTDFYARFTRDIVGLANEDGLGVDGRVVSVLEGGYSDRALTSGVLSHLTGLSGAIDPKEPYDPAPGLESATSVATFDPEWWSPARLEELEHLVDPAAPPVPTAPKRSARGGNPTYVTQTQSSTAKIVATSSRRSTSGLSPDPRASSRASVRAPSPPPPEVDWTAASFELSKLLIPSNRQTKSCRPEDLNAEATRARRDRQSVAGVQTGPSSIEEGKRIQLRERKVKASYKTDDEDEAKEPGPASMNGRRKTVAGAESLAAMSGAAGKARAPPARRRVSVTSAILSIAEDNADDGPVSRGQKMADVPQKRSSSSVSAYRVARTDGQDVPAPRKTRAPTTAPSSPSRTKAAKKVPTQPPIPQFPSASTNPPKPSALPPPQRGRPATAKAPPAAKSANHDLDALTSGVKKMSIKLNMPSREEQEAREVAARAPQAQPRPLPPGRGSSSK